MKLVDLISNEVNLKSEQLIGREVTLMGEQVLLVAIQDLSAFDEEENCYCDKVNLMVLHEEPDEWDEDEEEYENDEPTLREELTEMMDCGEPTLSDVCALRVYGMEYDVYDVSESWVGEQPYHQAATLKRALNAGVIPVKWQEKDADELYLIEYSVQRDMLDLNWNVDIMPIDAGFEAGSDELPVGQVLRLPCGRLEEPLAFQMETPQSGPIDVKIYGTFLLDVWKDAPMIGLDREDLEMICEEDEKLLAIEYSVEADVAVALNFYTTSQLDAPADEERPALMLGTEDHELRMLEVVPGDFDGEVEVELFSIEIFD